MVDAHIDYALLKEFEDKFRPKLIRTYKENGNLVKVYEARPAGNNAPYFYGPVRGLNYD